MPYAPPWYSDTTLPWNVPVPQVADDGVTGIGSLTKTVNGYTACNAVGQPLGNFETVTAARGVLWRTYQASGGAGVKPFTAAT